MRRSSACQALFLGSSGVTPLPRPVWAASPEGGGAPGICDHGNERYLQVRSQVDWLTW
jgi:hypothetical protein